MERFCCKFCNKFFVTKSNLNNHIKKAKYCIEKREQPRTEPNHICTFCNKSFATQYSITRHIKRCKINLKLEETEIDKKNKLLLAKDQEISLIKQKYDTEIRERETIVLIKIQEIEFLKKQLIDKTQEIESLTQKLSSLVLEGIRKPTVVNTSNKITNILTPLDLTEEKIKTIVENNLDESYFLDAQKGIARFCFDKLIKTEDGKRTLVCSDPIRERYKYLDKEGTLKQDMRARNFIDRISKPIIETSKKVHDNLKDKYIQIKEDIKRGFENDLSDFMVEMKQKYAEKCLDDICDIPYESTNKKFRKELAIKSNV